MSLILFAGALLLSAATPDTPGQDADGEKLLCKRDQSVGTRLAKRICMTRKQWADAESARSDGKKQIDDNSVRFGREGYLPYEKPGNPR